MGTLTAPSRLSNVTPQNDGGSTSSAIDVTRGTPLSVAWAGAIKEVQIYLNAGTPGYLRTETLCKVPASAGTFSVPGAVTQKDPVGFGTMTLSNFSTGSVTTGSWKISSTAAATDAVERRLYFH